MSVVPDPGPRKSDEVFAVLPLLLHCELWASERLDVVVEER